MKRMEVTILGQSYLLSCPEGGEQALLEAAGKVDREMCAIRDAGKIKARERIAVLAALNLAYGIAERPATPVAPSPLAAARSDPSLPGQEAHADVQALIARIDETLADDGRLL
jgi:cell division protein ZapA